MDEAKLIDKLRKIEALFAGATTAGEKDAAEFVKQRILDRLKLLAQDDPPIEYKFTLPDRWTRLVFVALLRRYELKPYRYRRQRHTTVMVRVSRRFVDETLWPHFQQLSQSLNTYLTEVTDRIVRQVLDADGDEAEVVDEPRLLGA